MGVYALAYMEEMEMAAHYNRTSAWASMVTLTSVMGYGVVHRNVKGFAGSRRHPRESGHAGWNQNAHLVALCAHR
jgi:hypothetical protein